MRLVTTCLIAGAIILIAANAQAAGRRRFPSRHAHEGNVPSGAIHHSAAVDPRAIYPKYQGGFHSRALQNIGVPTGDIGIRGNGFMLNPW
jgi:hypothetical protein